VAPPLSPQAGLGPPGEGFEPRTLGLGPSAHGEEGCRAEPLQAARHRHAEEAFEQQRSQYCPPALGLGRLFPRALVKRPETLRVPHATRAASVHYPPSHLRAPAAAPLQASFPSCFPPAAYSDHGVEAGTGPAAECEAQRGEMTLGAIRPPMKVLSTLESGMDKHTDAEHNDLSQKKEAK
jgi:hypothetical protein